MRSLLVVLGVGACACGGVSPTDEGPAEASSVQQVVDDHGDGPATATRIDPGCEGQASLHSAADVDVFAVEVRAGRIYRFTASGGPSGYSAAWSVRFLRHDGGTVPAAGSSRWNTALVGVRAERDETLYVHVAAGTMGDAGKLTYPATYALSLIDVGPDDHGSTPDTASPLTLGETVGGAIELGNDTDAFAVTLAGERSTRVALVGKETETRFQYELRDANGQLVPPAYWSGGPQNEYAPVPAGTYTLLVRSWTDLFSPGVGSYALTVTQPAP